MTGYIRTGTGVKQTEVDCAIVQLIGDPRYTYDLTSLSEKTRKSNHLLSQCKDSTFSSVILRP